MISEGVRKLLLIGSTLEFVLVCTPRVHRRPIASLHEEANMCCEGLVENPVGPVGRSVI